MKIKIKNQSNQSKLLNNKKINFFLVKVNLIQNKQIWKNLILMKKGHQKFNLKNQKRKKRKIKRKNKKIKMNKK